MKKILLILCLLCISCSQEPQSLDDLRSAGKKAFIKADYAAAQKYFGQALLIKSSDKEVLYFLGQTFQKQMQNDSALFYLKRADILHTNDRELNLAIYTSAKIVKDYQNALKAIMVLINTGDAPEKYYYELADYNLRTGSVAVSFYYLKLIWNEGTENPAIYSNLGNVAAQIDSLDFAIKIMEEAIDKFGEEETFMVDLAIYKATVGKLTESENMLRSLLAKSPSSKIAKFALGNILVIFDSNEKNEEALKIYEELRVEFGNVLSLDSLIIDLLQKIEK